MTKNIFLLMIALALSGCYSTTWECQEDKCISYQMASNRCLAQANSAFSSSKMLIWSQCMQGYGYAERQCNRNEYTQNPCVALGMHVM